MPHQEAPNTPSVAETAEIMREAIVQLREMYVYCKLRTLPYEFSEIERAEADKLIADLPPDVGCRDALDSITTTLYRNRLAQSKENGHV
jgi:hypothetical protein